jgi:crossover junction endodeoxyribonuclease RusA
MRAPSYKISLPWPPKGLSPNDRRHRMAVAGKRRQYRADCAWSTIAANVRRIEASALRVRITFHPPDARARDLDNMLASIKSGLDGVADVIGIDDSRWTLVLAVGAPVRFGRVNLVLEPHAATS